MISLQNMRMSCDSTYLLDHETDHGYKADELIDLLHEIFEEDQVKAVVFSQWLGTHELIIRRLGRNGWGHQFLHGGVPSPKRKDLVKNFREDPKCRLFLSTEAGGVGMNLQNASTVVSMDLPWNPAVLEQRIGRVHRLGQRRPVRVVNFIASGTIEHGMLSLLSFKQSLFAGVLDGGQDVVFLGGSRLKRFMESVEKATGAIPPAAVREPETLPPAGEEFEKKPAPAGAETQPAPLRSESAWAEVASAGLAFLDKLSQALLEPAGKARPPETPAQSLPGLAQAFLERDATGRAFLKLPVPHPDTLKKVADLLYELSGK